MQGSGATAGSRRVVLALGVAVLGAVVLWLVVPDGEEPAGTGGPVEEFMHVHGLETPAWGGGAVYVSTHQGAFRVDGDSWQWVSETPHDLMGFAAHPMDEGTFYASGHPAADSDLPNPVGFMVSTDGGVSWEPRSLQGEVDFHAMAVHQADGEVVYGYDGRQGLLRSDDAGRTWEAVESTGLGEAGGVLGLAVGPDDAVLAGTEQGLLRSGDAGSTWETILEGPATTVRVEGRTGRIVAYAADGRGLVTSEDGGDSWEPSGLVLEDDAASHVAVSPDDPDEIWVGTFGEGLWRTVDGGRQWQQLAEDGRPTPPT